MERTCHSCGKDPGSESTCRHCGARVYRFAVDHDEWLKTVGESGYVMRDPTGPSDRELVGDAFDDLDISPSASTIREIVEEPFRYPTRSEEPWQSRAETPTPTPQPVGAPQATGQGCRGCLVAVIVFVVVAAIGAFLFAATLGGGTISQSFGDLLDDMGLAEDTTSLVANTPTGSAPADAGPCLDLTVLGDVVSERAVVPCEGPHDAEQYHVESIPEGPFPGEDQLAASAASTCFDRFEAYVGRPYATSAYYYDWLVPTASGWEAGDRDVLCLIVSGDGSPLVGAARDSGR